MRRLKSFAKWTGLLAGLFVLTGVLGLLIPLPLSTVARPIPAEEERSILLLSNPIHTDIAFPADPDVLAAFSFLSDSDLDPAAPGVRWIIAGWGGRAFYLETPTWADLKPGPAFKALTVDAAVMHVALAGDIDASHEWVREIFLTDDDFVSLLAAVQTSFTRDGTGQPINLQGKGYGPFDRFYEAEGWFNVIVGCNVWTASVLRAAGLRTGFWTPLPFLLNASLDLHD